MTVSARRLHRHSVGYQPLSIKLQRNIHLPFSKCPTPTYNAQSASIWFAFALSASSLSTFLASLLQMATIQRRRNLYAWRLYETCLASTRTLQKRQLFNKILLGVSAGYIGLMTALTIHFRLKYHGSLFNDRMRSKKDLRGYYVIVTGSNKGGIGFEIAKYMVLHGAHVVLACRNERRGKLAAALINAAAQTNDEYYGGEAEYMHCDLSSLESTRSFIAEYKESGYPLHILSNNAGIAGPATLEMTRDGHETVWQTNYLSHFLITHELMPLMIRSSVDNDSIENQDINTFDCRIVNTSSCFHEDGHVDFEILKSNESIQRKNYIPLPYIGSGYARSKLAQIMQEIFKKHEIPIHTASVHPGVVRTNIYHFDPESNWFMNMFTTIYRFVFYPVWRFGLRSLEEGSRTNIYCAVAPHQNHDHMSPWGGVFVPGGYHENMKRCATKDVHGQSVNWNEMKKLYEYSLETLGLRRFTLEQYEKMKMDPEIVEVEEENEENDENEDEKEEESALGIRNKKKKMKNVSVLGIPIPFLEREATELTEGDHEGVTNESVEYADDDGNASVLSALSSKSKTEGNNTKHSITFANGISYGRLQEEEEEEQKGMRLVREKPKENRSEYYDDEKEEKPLEIDRRRTMSALSGISLSAISAKGQDEKDKNPELTRAKTEGHGTKEHWFDQIRKNLEYGLDEANLSQSER